MDADRPDASRPVGKGRHERWPPIAAEQLTDLTRAERRQLKVRHE